MEKLHFMQAQVGHEGTSCIGDEDIAWRRINASRPHLQTRMPHDGEISCLKASMKENTEVGHPWVGMVCGQIEERQKHIDFKLRELVMRSPKIELIEAECLTINLPSVSALVTVRAEGDQIFVIVGSTEGPRNNVMNVNFDVSTSWDRTSVPGLD